MYDFVYIYAVTIGTWYGMTNHILFTQTFYLAYSKKEGSEKIFARMFNIMIWLCV